MYTVSVFFNILPDQIALQAEIEKEFPGTGITIKSIGMNPEGKNCAVLELPDEIQTAQVFLLDSDLFKVLAVEPVLVLSVDDSDGTPSIPISANGAELISPVITEKKTKEEDDPEDPEDGEDGEGEDGTEEGCGGKKKKKKKESAIFEKMITENIEIPSLNLVLESGDQLTIYPKGMKMTEEDVETIWSKFRMYLRMELQYDSATTERVLTVMSYILDTVNNRKKMFSTTDLKNFMKMMDRNFPWGQ